MKLSTKIRGYLIKLLAGELPVVLNVVISRPRYFMGELIDLSRSDEHVIGNNILLSTPTLHLLTPLKDTLYSQNYEWDAVEFVSRNPV